MTSAPKRRWSFSLRTLFVVVTVVACFGGSVTKQVHDRERVLESLRSNPPMAGNAFILKIRPMPTPWTTPAVWIRPRAGAHFGQFRLAR